MREDLHYYVRHLDSKHTEHKTSKITKDKPPAKGRKRGGK